MKKSLIVIGIVLVSLFAWYKWSIGAPGDGSEKAVVTIERGTGVKGIALELKQQGMIRSEGAFSLYNRWHGTQGELKAGQYSLDNSMGVAKIVEVMTGGVSQEMRITIPEGYSVKDIDALVAEQGLAPAGAITECAQTCDFSAFAFLPKVSNLAPRGGKLEGYLYPETYFVNPGAFDPESFLKRLLETFQERVADALDADIKASGHPLHDVVTMASLVEEEAKGEQERRMVAGILWERIEQGIGLYVDATTRYIVNKPTAALTTTDLDIDSPYNTRKYRDLPPGPIASPSLQSIKATISPTPSEYLYYLHGSDGQIRYARTNDEHNANKQRYLR